MKNLFSNKGAALLGVVLLVVMILALVLPRVLTFPLELTDNSTQSAAIADPGMAARWQAMGEFYTRQQADDAQRAAEAARWQAMGEFYTRQQADDARRASEAMGARWQAMGDYYAAQAK